jgi:hypothetical protein
MVQNRVSQTISRRKIFVTLVGEASIVFPGGVIGHAV